VGCEAYDRKRLEQLRRYITRPALSDERVQLNAAGQVELKLKTTSRDGTTLLVMSPLELMQQLAALVPRPVAKNSPANDCFAAVNRGTRMPGVGRQRQFETFGCSRSAANLSRSSSGARERPLSRTPTGLTASAKVRFQSGPVAHRENCHRLLWVGCDR